MVLRLFGKGGCSCSTPDALRSHFRPRLSDWFERTGGHQWNQ